ncbi:MAG: hypothetical protein KDA56_06365 [Hyphomonas sp.]|jgi:hypothetical protein|nr:hypothetical protein [Hyphomonas sp.]
MKIEMQKFAVGGVLAGAIDGRDAFLAILGDCARAPSIPQILILDFKGISLATASFLRECVFALKDHMRARRSNWYPVLANVSATIEDELSILTQAGRDALILINCGSDGEIQAPRLFGDLDPKHQRTFEMVAERGEADATSLAAAYGHSEQLENTTAWNNRLRTLSERGVLMEFSKGRAKTYKPAW